MFRSPFLPSRFDRSDHWSVESGARHHGRNLTEKALLHSEVRYQTIVENLTEGLAVSDLSGQMLHFNRAALDMHGFATLKETRRHLTNSLTYSNSLAWTARSGRWINGRSPASCAVRRFATWRRAFGASDRLAAGLNYGGTLVHDTGGQPMMAVITISDITERERAAEEIRQLNVELEARVVERTAQLQAAIRNWKRFRIPFPTICARRCATWRDSWNC